MSTVGPNTLAWTMLMPTTVAVRPKEDPNAPNDGAWQRALVSASPASASSAVSAATASRLFDLNAAIAAPAAELVMAPSKLAPAALMSSLKSDDAMLHASRKSDVAPVRVHAALAFPRVDTREVETSADRRPNQPAVDSTPSAAAKSAGRTAPGERAGKGASTSRAGAAERARSVALAFATPLAGPERALAAYAEAMSAGSATSNAAISFTLVSTSSVAPVRVHVQWSGRMADVWIGLHRRAFNQLPDIRAGIQDWVSSRGGVVSRLVCNGERLSGAALSSSFQGVL